MKSRTRRARRLKGSLKTRVRRLENFTILQVDRKYKVNADTCIPDAAAPHITTINNIGQGNGQNQRIGTSVHLGKGHIQGSLVWNNPTAPPHFGTHNVRFIMVLYKDKLPNVAPTLLEIGLFDTATPAVHQFYNFVNNNPWKNCRVLFDKIIQQKQPVGYSDPLIPAPQRSIVRFGWDCKNYKAQWNGSGSAITDLDQGAVLLYTITDAVNSNTCAVYLQHVQYYTEERSK